METQTNINNRLSKRRITFRLLPFAFHLLFAFTSKAQTYIVPPTTGTLAPGDYYNNIKIQLNNHFSFTAGAGQHLYLYVPGPTCIPLVTAPSSDKTYIMTTVPRIAGITDTSMLHNRSACDLMQTVQYFDGIGRPIQTVQVMGSPTNKDLVQPVEYDPIGREAKKYLPYAISSGTSDGTYKANALTSAQAQFYNPSGGSTITQQSNGMVNTSYASATTLFEESPLNRVKEVGAPGATWQPGSGHTVTTVYGTNGGTDVVLWAVNSAGNGLVGGTTNYIAGTLYATITTDENGFNSIEYKDKDGRVVCKKVQSTPTAGSYIATYYVYNNEGNLSYVIPPNPSGAAYPATILETDATFSNYIYGYHYDERNRLIQKQVPGKGWEYMVYNRLDQLALSQDAVQRTTNVWTVTKYDAQGRVILTGTWPSAGQTQSALQTAIYAGPQWDIRNYTDNVTGYTITSYPVPNKILAINYYDDYTNIPGMPVAFPTSGYSTMTRGLLTATRTSVLNTMGNTTPDVLYAAHYYDDLGHVVKTYQQHYLGGILSANNYDILATVYDFTDEITSSTRQHYKNVSSSAALSLTIANTYHYDHTGRKTQTFEKINADPSILLSQSDYNPIGQLTTKHLHSATGTIPFSQDISYKYNERGWLKRINDPVMTPSATRMFSEQLNYDSVAVVSTQQKFNGNITEQLFRVYNSTFTGVQQVTYSYDPMSRLNSGTSTTSASETGITYDNLGNIKTLTRGANTGTYGYINGSQLQSVSGITGSNYTYDANGNVFHDGRNNATVTYNLLNLPQTVTGSTINITYIYDANGEKLRKVSTVGGVTTNTDYIDGIQYKTDAATIDFIQTEEGRAVNTGTNYIYEYTLTDHLGNNRLTFDQVNGKVGEEDYYPYGLNIHRSPNPGNKYLYNKKELQDEITEYDYGARFYDPVIGRMTRVDPDGEKFYPLSSYSYVANNPILLNDPSGKNWSIHAYVDKNGKLQVDITVNAAVYNRSGKKINMQNFIKNQTETFSRIFSTDNKDYSVTANLNLRAVDNLDQVEEKEHLVVISNGEQVKDFAIKPGSDEREDGYSSPGGLRVDLNSAGIYHDGTSANKGTLSHELGHTGGLVHPFDKSGGVSLIGEKYLGFLRFPNNRPLFDQLKGVDLTTNFMSYPFRFIEYQTPEGAKQLHQAYGNPGRATNGQIEAIVRYYLNGDLNKNDK